MLEKNNQFIVAIDGYSSCGKSTLAKAIAKKLGFKYIDSGAMYRAIAYYAISNNLITDNNIYLDKLLNRLDEINIDFIYDPVNDKSITLLNNENIEDKIRNEKIATIASKLSQIKEIREKIVEIQRKIAKDNKVVMDGRDIGTIVFPDADIKIFMTADENIRIQRRYKELIEKGENIDIDEIKNLIKIRDREDENRNISPLSKDNDAIVLDNTNMSPEEQFEWFKNIYDRKLEEKNRNEK